MSDDRKDAIRIHGARQNNLKNLDLEIPLNELVVVTGVSGSGKSSLVFDTLYAEGQRRYVETFSPYARQFLDRMDKPAVDRIEGIPPAIAIDQTNPVRTSRSTVGTMTELNDHIKLLYARAGHLHCRACGQPVRRDTPQSISDDLVARAAQVGDPRLIVTFPISVPKNFSEAEIEQLLNAQGYTRIHARDGNVLHVVQDRFRAGGAERARIVEAIEAALRVGNGRVNIHAAGDDGTTTTTWKYSSDLHCADDDLHYAEPTPSLFSFNSPLGACETCRGFGRVIGIDFGLVIPDTAKSLAEGAIKPWQTESYKESQSDLALHAKKRGVAMDIAWRDLPEEHRQWVLEGDADFRSWEKSWPGKWYGVRRFFAWLETKAYKMHIRVLLSKYRAYTPCADCDGARLKPEALQWRVGTREDADAALGPFRRYRPRGTRYADEVLQSLAGLSIHDLMLLPIERVKTFVDDLHLPAPLDEATDLLLAEIRARVNYLCEVGLGYLTLDRQSRTLSGGEVQRINLTTALGTSLVNTLFVLDEPSIGLHPRDMGRVIDVMHRLRDAGNSLVVVEHDPQIMLEADRILDIGPGPGERGGTVVFNGTPDELRAAKTLTAEYLSGRARADAGVKPRVVKPSAPKLVLEGAREHNLKQVGVEIPLGHLVCVTGVSGSGKSTLIQDVLYPALLKKKGKPTETPGAHARLLGDDWLAEVTMVDQTPIGKSSRSNPASYVGAFDAIRNLYAAAPESKERGYTAGTFSFNAGNGRCPTCSGSGFEHVEMQFLSDVYLRCPDCDGTRYRAEVREVKLAGKSIADALDMTVSEAVAFFAAHPEVKRVLQPLADVGLEYLRLGQPVPTLSGGEAQRLKLAGHLVESGTPPKGLMKKGKLFLFDEPTTGLHFDDTAKLLRAFRQLIDAGHSLIVIEHNLDVIRASDWIIDLGPEGGEAGGEIVCTGTPGDVMACAASHTGTALRQYEASFAQHRPLPLAAEPRPAYRAVTRGDDAIRIHNAREHNLKNIDISLPRDKFTVITGVSGSGKSTLAFDIVFGEGQRRYLESLNAYARQFVQPASKPDVDAIWGIPPTVAIEQRTSRGGRKSTVATLTEIYHFLRLLYVKLGVQHCPNDGTPIAPQSPDAIAARILRDWRGKRIGLLAPLVVNRKGLYTDLAKWAKGKGYTHLRVDGKFLPTKGWPRLDRFKEHSIDLPVADLTITSENEGELRSALAQALQYGKGVAKVIGPLDALAAAFAAAKENGSTAEAELHETVFSTKRACPTCGTSYPELDPRLFSFNSKHGWCEDCYGTGLKIEGFDAEQSGEEIWWNDWFEGEAETCPSCHGERLNPVARNVRYRERSISQLTALSVGDTAHIFDRLSLDGREAEIARDLVAELRSRLSFLGEVGLGYLSLDRAAPTLSGGEAQRIRLAAQLGSNLRGVCYILDEPTIGLHPRDNRILLDTLEKLEAKGNTLLVVEHDEDTIRRAHHVVDLGPGAGSQGGRVVAAGTADELMASEASITGRFLREPLRHPVQPRRKVGKATPSVDVIDADLHNLKCVTASVPLGRLTVITGVSGSGKSTLARDVIHDNLWRLVGAERKHKDVPLAGCAEIHGWEAIGRVLEVDQTPIGKTPRSCPATYVGFWDAIRKLYAEAEEARIRGFNASRFSFNTAGGRCEACEGQGIRKIEMSFLPDVKVHCDECRGQRFNTETLAVHWKGRSIGEVLMMSVDEAVEFFAAHRSIHHALRLLQDVGLGYLTLGQQSPTLSGGEAQRIKLVTELSKVRAEGADAANRPGRGGAKQHTFYVLDEPTVGLHMADVEKLIRVLHRLVDAGNSVLLIEHNLDVIAEADWIIDMGPEGGDAGGNIVLQGTPEDFAAQPAESHTAKVMAEFLAARGMG
ncbi:MAG TPA: excinuclease ABC subunit UvrA [Rhodocyclaceae bacterium]|nr:excinuclease ABC subunit UvrA [Rhodocyclaceae bacterium]HNH13196.1 excinuclease ABC subunit UvrA [Rhodocyclaceae bacterium]HNH99751.1 excinuclease ABC subunit UvrA [Rhodocyclaceae bacterium]